LPPQRIHGATFVYDPDSARVLMFGGIADNYPYSVPVDSLFELRLQPQPTWIRPSTIFHPEARTGLVAVLDRVRRRMLIEGGVSPSINSIWALELTGTPRWAPLAASGVGPGRVVAATAFAAMDDARARVVIGDSGNDTTWTLSLEGTPNWSFVLHNGARPPSRPASVAAADPRNQRLVLLGLRDSTGQWAPSAFTLDYASLEWSPFPALPDTFATPVRPTAAVDPASGLLWMAGLGERSDGTWTIPGAGNGPWSRHQGRGPDPHGLPLGALWVDAATNRAYFMGGGLTSDWSVLWSLALDGDAATRFYWTDTTLAAGLPPRGVPSWAFDSRRRALLVFGGDKPGGGVIADLQRFDVATRTWQALPTSGPTPGPRAGAQAVYDSVTDQMYMYGGGSPTATDVELWSLALSTSPPQWNLIPVAQHPASNQSGVALALDSHRGRLILFGGSNPLTADVWMLDPLAAIPTWSLMATEGAPPPGRGYVRTIYDPIGDRLIVYEGSESGDLWALSLLGTPTWSRLDPAFEAPPREMYASAYDAAHDRMLVYGGYPPAAHSIDRDLRVLQWERDRTVLPHIAPTRTPLQLAVLWNPSPASVRFQVRLIQAGDIRVELVDMAGRRVFSTTFPALYPGTHVLSFETAVTPGIYFVRVHQGGREASARVAIVR
jgi:hypothetical protein